MQEKTELGDFAQLGMVYDRFDQVLGKILSAKSGNDSQTPDFPDVFVFIQRCPAKRSGRNIVDKQYESTAGVEILIDVDPCIAMSSRSGRTLSRPGFSRQVRD